MKRITCYLRCLGLLACLIFLAACGPEKGPTLSCNGGGSFNTIGPKESFSVLVEPPDHDGIYRGEIIKKSFGVVYRGPMLAFSQSECSPERGWGAITSVSESGIHFKEGLSLIGTKPIDTLRNNGTTLTTLQKPPNHPIGIDTAANWVGSPSGHEVYAIIRQDGESYFVTLWEDFRIRFGSDIPDRAVAPEHIRSREIEPYILIRNALSKDVPSSHDAKLLTYRFPAMFVTDHGHILFPERALKTRCSKVEISEQQWLGDVPVNNEFCDDIF